MRVTHLSTGVVVSQQDEKIRTYNFPQSRVTDHRVGFTTRRLAEMLDGDLAEVGDVLAAHYRAGAPTGSVPEP